MVIDGHAVRMLAACSSRSSSMASSRILYFWTLPVTVSGLPRRDILFELIARAHDKADLCSAGEECEQADCSEDD